MRALLSTLNLQLPMDGPGLYFDAVPNIGPKFLLPRF